MNKIGKLIGIIMTLATLSACTPHGSDDPIVSESDLHRTVVYTVAGTEQSATLKTDAEWDALLDDLCSFAEQEGQIAFYSITTPSTTPRSTKEKSTFTTTDRLEMKEWMKEMEKQGKTVNVVYDKETGVWNGTAYAGMGGQNIQQGQEYRGRLSAVEVPSIHMPQESHVAKVWALVVNEDSTLLLAVSGQLLPVLDEDDEFGLALIEEAEAMLYGVVSQHESADGSFLVLELSTVKQETLSGTWQLVDLTKVVQTSEEGVAVVEMYWWNDGGQPAYYHLMADGTATLEQEGTSTSGTWGYTESGMLCCSLFEGGECWNINWVSSETLILTRDEHSSTDGDVHYQMMLTDPNTEIRY